MPSYPFNSGTVVALLEFSGIGSADEVRMLNKLRELRGYKETEGAIGYILLWAMGVPASLLFLIFLLRGCD